MNAAPDLRPSPIAGQWYPADPQRLAASVDGYLNAADLPELDGELVGIMTPHAGHRYSGPVAGYAFAALGQLQPELIAVLSPMHYATSYPLLTTAHQAYATPLGPIPVDNQAISDLHDCLQQKLGFGLTAIKHDPEHSLEIELPFLQRALQHEFRLLPVMVREVSRRVTCALGDCLATILQGKKALLVASTDLSHFYPQQVAEALDAEVLRRVEALDPEGVLQVEEEGKGFACGRGALAAVLWAARELGADRARVLRYATSGNVTGDFSEVVGYAAAAFIKKVEKP